jgi:dienelactone hydrolase
MPAHSQEAQVLSASEWRVYGTAYARAHDADVPGENTVRVDARAVTDQPWSSGAALPVPGALAAGERVNAVFWARAERPMAVTIGLQGGAPGYARFAQAEVKLTPGWQEVTISGTAPSAFAAGSQSLSVPLGLASGSVTLGPVAFQRGAPDQDVVAKAFATFRPASVATDVTIPSEPGVALAGTLYLPVGRVGPVPIAVLVQGHGRNGRGGFPEVVKRLAADGIAALEYDKRGIGQSTGEYREDIERLTADAAAAVAAMRRRPEIDGRRIALVGQSQGGVIAPAVAAADSSIAAVVTLAGSVGDGLPYLRQALRNQMIAARRPAASIDPVVDAAIALIQGRIDNRDAAAMAPLRATLVDRLQASGFTRVESEAGLAIIDTEEVVRAPRLRSASDLRALRVPVLAVFGTLDPLVVASQEAPAARTALAGNPRGQVMVLDGLSHWFQEGATTGTAEESAALGPNLGSPRVISLVGDWLRDALAPRRLDTAQ